MVFMNQTFDPLKKIVNERVRMPGSPQIVVTRGFLYTWLKSMGWSPRERGFGSLDYAVFGRPAVLDPLTVESERDRLLGQVEHGYRRDTPVAAIAMEVGA